MTYSQPGFAVMDAAVVVDAIGDAWNAVGEGTEVLGVAGALGMLVLQTFHNWHYSPLVFCQQAGKDTDLPLVVLSSSVSCFFSLLGFEKINTTLLGTHLFWMHSMQTRLGYSTSD